MRTTILFVALMAFCAGSFARADANQDAQNPDFWRIADVEVSFREPDATEFYSFALEQNNYNPDVVPFTDPSGNPAVFSVDRLSFVGPETLKIVEDGEATPEALRGAGVAVVPQGLRSVDLLKGWNGSPTFVVMELAMVNAFKIRLARANLKVVATYGGTYNGKGKFLKSVTVLPSDVKTYLGTDFFVWAEFREPVNLGTKKGEPIAGLGFDVRYKAGTFVNKVEGARDFFITGTGQITSNN